MKLVKSLLLGSVAGLCAAVEGQAADLPMKKAAPVEYVRVCTAYGAGFFYIPGTDTCLRVGGRARFEYNYTQQGTRNSSVSGYRGQARLNIDARTQTPYGSLRAFVRLEVASRTGSHRSGTQERLANAFAGTGQDTSREAQKFVDVDKAFIQFGGLTAGRAQSFYDFYAADLDFIGSGIYSSTNTNLAGYTVKLDSGFSVTLSAEDPTFRRHPVFLNATTGPVATAPGVAPATQGGVNFLSGSIPLAFVGNNFNAAGIPTSAVALDPGQRNNMPDFVGALRLDQAWGSAQLSAAVHEIRTGTFTGGAFAVNGGAAVAGAARLPESAYGFAVQGGLKLNLPQLAPGDQLWLQGAYAQGGASFTGITGPTGISSATGSLTNRFQVTQADAVLNNVGRLILTESLSVTSAFLHYWSPQVRQAVFATYGQQNYDPRLRNANFGPAGVTPTIVNPFSATLLSYDLFYGGSNLIWSPVRDLDIGVEAVYQRLWLPNRVADANKGGTAVAAAAVVGGTGRTTTYDDNIIVRFRVQRDF